MNAQHSLLNALAGDKKIAFIGCGNMAQAIIAGLIQSGWPQSQIIASNPTQSKLENFATRLLDQFEFKLVTTDDNQSAAQQAHIVVLAVKPQILSQVCRLLSTVNFSHKLIISIAAGYETSQIVAHLNQSPAIIRCMPNTPAFIGEAASGLFANPQVNQQQKQLAEGIFSSVGTAHWIDLESQMNLVTAIAGSSPAYFFLFMEAMVEHAVSGGMAESTARDMISQTMLGTAKLVQYSPQKSLQQLRLEVTSKGGTTNAAIEAFQSDGFEQIVRQALNAAVERGIELAE